MVKIKLNGLTVDNVVSVNQYNKDTFRIVYRTEDGKLERIDINIDSLVVAIDGEVYAYDRAKLDSLRFKED